MYFVSGMSPVFVMVSVFCVLWHAPTTSIFIGSDMYFVYGMSPVSGMSFVSDLLSVSGLALVSTMKEIFEVEENPCTSSLNICPEANGRGYWNKNTPPPPYQPISRDPWIFNTKTT